MPKYLESNFSEFMAKVNTADTTFNLKRSSLNQLIELLSSDACTAQKVVAEISKIKQNKKIKYWDALLHLRMTMDGVGHLILPGGGAGLGKCNAALLKKVPVLPTIYTRAWVGEERRGIYSGPDKFKMLEPETRYLGMTVEQFIWEHHGKVGIILIHLGKIVEGIDMQMGGKSCADHINSVLNVAAKKNLKLCALHLFEGNYVNSLLSEAYQKVGQRTTVYRPDKHEGGDIKAFKDFADAHDVCVVMGWDADVCVSANVLGSASFDDSTNRLITPILGRTDVVTARPLIITIGDLGNEEWGVLRGS
ncbi:hypothetical protein ACFL2V_12815 [Pseudomonadota bacterium]